MGTLRWGGALALVLVVLGLAPVASAPASVTPAQLGKCLALTGRSALRTGPILEGLGLQRSTAIEVRLRLSQYNSVRGFPGLVGIDGLTPEQSAEIIRRVKAQRAARPRPIGSPCPPFKNPAKVIEEVRTLLVYNGFLETMTFHDASPRQIRFRAIKDGIGYFGVVVKTAQQQILIKLQSTDSDGESTTVPLNFDA